LIPARDAEMFINLKARGSFPFLFFFLFLFFLLLFWKRRSEIPVVVVPVFVSTVARTLAQTSLTFTDYNRRLQVSSSDFFLFFSFFFFSFIEGSKVCDYFVFQGERG